MATRTPTKPKPTKQPAAVITREDLENEEAEDLGSFASLGQHLRDQLLKRVLTQPAGAAMIFDAWKTEPVNNEELMDYLKEIWDPAVKLSERPLLCCASSQMGPALVWFGQDHSHGSPHLSGDELLDAVRRVMDLPGPDGKYETLKANGKSRPKAVEPAKEKPKAPAKVSAADLFAGVEVIEERDVEYSKIIRSKHNPRQSFDEQLINEMAPNIVTICQLTPLTIREGTFELIDGETRHRAGAVGKAKALRCKVVRCTDAQAAAMRLMSSLQRRDLNPLERARALKQLQEEHGLSQRQLADVVKLEQGTISNLTRLLDLPDKWQARVISGEITPSAARELVPWLDEPEVMKEIESDLKHWDKEERSQRLGRIINGAARAKSRPMHDSYFYDSVKGCSREVNLRPSDEVYKQLRVRKMGTESRAFNLKLWEELQTAAEKKREEAAMARAEKKGKPGAKIDPKQARENERKAKEMLARKLYKFRVAWYQAMIVAEVEDAADSDLVALLLYLSTRNGNADRSRCLEELVPLGKEKSTINHHSGSDPIALLSGLMKMSQQDEHKIGTYLQKLVGRQLSSKFDGYHNTIDPEEYELIAKHFDIDIKRDWTVSFDDGGPCERLWPTFCGLWTCEQIAELLQEWKLPNTLGEKAKRGDLVKLLTAAKGCPKAILDAVPVRLS